MTYNVFGGTLNPTLLLLLTDELGSVGLLLVSFYVCFSVFLNRISLFVMGLVSYFVYCVL